MFASWSRLLVVLLAGTIAFAAPGRELWLGPHMNPPPGNEVKEGQYVFGKAEHFDPPGTVSISPNLLFGFGLKEEWI